MASIIRLERMGKKGKRVHFYLQYKNDENKFVRKYLKGITTQKDADKILATHKNKEINFEHENPIKRIDVTIQDALDEFIEAHAGKKVIRGVQRKNNTVRTNLYDLKIIREWFQFKKLNRFDKISETYINDFRNDLHGDIFGYRLSSIKNYEKMLIRFLWWANGKYYFMKSALIKDYKIVSNAEIDAEKLVICQDRGYQTIDDSKFFSKNEIIELFDKLRPEYHDILQFVYKTGIRIGEATSLKWIEYQEKRKIIVLNFQEGRKPQDNTIVYLSEEAIEILKRQPRDNGYIFIQGNGKAFLPDSIRTNVRNACNELGLTGKSTHTLRHTFASELLDDGANILEVQRLLRHSTDSETKKYIHTAETSLFNVLNRKKGKKGDR